MNRILKDEEFLPYLQKTINNASKNITLSTFKAEICEQPRGRYLKRLFDDIIRKAKEGLKIKLLLNWHDDKKSVARTNYRVMHDLKAAGVKVKHLHANRCNHAKICIVDDCLMFIGSHNLSVRSCHNNFELSMLITEQDKITEVKNIFDQSFNDAKTW